MPSLTLGNIVNVLVLVGPTGAVSTGFDLGLLVGPTAVITGNPGDRVRLYGDTASMLADGFQAGDPEYVAASLYFSQIPRPVKLAVGRWLQGTETRAAALTACRGANSDWYAFSFVGADKAAVEELARAAEALVPAAVQFYTTSDAEVLAGSSGVSQVETATIAGTISQSGNVTITVTAAGMPNSPKAISVAVLNGDTADVVAGKVRTALAADADVSSMFAVSGSGASVVLTRRIWAANDATLNVASTNGTSLGLTPAATSANTVAGVLGSIALQLKGLGYTRSLGQYSTVAEAAAAVMGYAMGANTGATNSAYTLAYKPEVGVTPEALTESQVATLKAGDANVYINRGGAYNLFEQGVVASGMHFDERLGLDQLASELQIAVMNLLAGVSKVPQNDAGMGMLFNALDGPCRKAASRGFLGPGVWRGAPILALKTGDNLPFGYAILADNWANLSKEDLAARKAPPIYIPLNLAGAVESVLVTVQVNQ